MKHEIKTEHGRVVADFPDDFVHDFDALNEAAEYLDSSGVECNAGTLRVEYNKKDGQAIGSITWISDEEEQ